ncbi:hypothetical protein Pyn_21976 [Prunus yedoensis var. nudiflora]|uniref:Uncharacterized protein n=1 Tax=Prunus yedoensis var. nudiflora TaxID=2094558 RepID=A0A314UTP7_PRUYE|nr:hypothetical protein Pyn_21976 [Prunus yedoensis var. nudiflora]
MMGWMLRNDDGSSVRSPAKITRQQQSGCVGPRWWDPCDSKILNDRCPSLSQKAGAFPEEDLGQHRFFLQTESKRFWIFRWILAVYFTSVLAKENNLR